MSILKYKITFLSYWAVGSGKGGGLAADSLVLKEKGLPIIPGKTLKGLIREAYRELDAVNVIKLFGHEKKNDESDQSVPNEVGCLHFGTARIPKEIRNVLENDKALANELYHSRTSTALEENSKQAKENSLRKMEVCVPLSLETEIDGDFAPFLENIKNALKGVRYIGEKRYRGLGRCHLEIIEPLTAEQHV
jgi:CRISPR/Cas system CSM-associated protein Csm3 (group 7 of RAMP superfamily)